MKINLNKVFTTPPNMEFNFCVFGEPSPEITAWINHWGFNTSLSGKYTNIIVGNINVNDIFDEPKVYEYVDGFSPNLNKHLHLGHLSNLIIAKAYQCLGVGNKFIAILGDTLSGNVDKADALNKYKDYLHNYDYHVDDILYASQQKITHTPLIDGVDDYAGTKVFKSGDEYIVGIKSDGSTSYFYQDVALAEKLNNSTLYLTGLEQSNHFTLLSNLFPTITHIGLGLVTIDGKKMSSSEGNVIYAEDVLNIFLQKFNNDPKLAWNVLSGYILKYSPEAMKDIKLETLDNVKLSLGLYLSYTCARLKSAGMVAQTGLPLNSTKLQFNLLKARTNLAPNAFFAALVDHAKDINTLYKTHYIKDNKENEAMYQPMLNDLVQGLTLLGMYEIDKV